jgi:predicted transcriptional regulator
MLRTLEEKGHVTHIEDGRAYIYEPRVQKEAAREGALSHLLKTFFDGSTEKAVAALLDMKASQLSRAELDRVAALVNQAKVEGR